MSLTVQSILGPDGRISQRLPDYEMRPEQLRMAEAVANAIADKEHLVVEAGTGVGKSFAYLVPAILAAAAPQQGEKPKRIVVSTHTISLQEQLIAKDIPFLNAVMPVEFSAVLVKGRSNYISLRRMHGAIEKAATLLTDPEEAEQLKRIRDWSQDTTDGSRSALSFNPLPTVWEEIQSEHDNCLGRRCPTYKDCFYFSARARMERANILVVNHALFFTDLALRMQDASVLPDYDVVVLDEAHTVESVAGSHMGQSLSDGQFSWLLRRLHNERKNTGLLRTHGLTDKEKTVYDLRNRLDSFFGDVRFWRQMHGGSNGRVRERIDVQDEFSPMLTGLAGDIHKFAEKLQDEAAKSELNGASIRCDTLAYELKRWLNQADEEDFVYWVETSQGRRQQTRMMSAPVEVGPLLREELFNNVDTVVLASATLATGGEDFSYVRNRLGLTRAREQKLGSPFDYRRQAKLVIADRMPDPSTEPQQFERAVCQRLKKHLPTTDGRAFVLFTSYTMMKNCAAELTDWFREHEFALFSQADGLPRTQMIERFRDTPRAVLFGVESFWQGVDVPGEALQNVIITKLPFAVPDHPLLQARMEAIRQRGGNPFMEYQVPQAVIKLKQGFGRLIRRATDTGQVVILDPRVRTKRYGRIFLNSLPECEVLFDAGEM